MSRGIVLHIAMSHVTRSKHDAFPCATYPRLKNTCDTCSVLQHTTTHCNTLQHTATHHNILQHPTYQVAHYKNMSYFTLSRLEKKIRLRNMRDMTCPSHSMFPPSQPIRTQIFLWRIFINAQLSLNTHYFLKHSRFALDIPVTTFVLMERSGKKRGGGLGSRPKKMYGERLGDGVEYHSMKPTPRR